MGSATPTRTTTPFHCLPLHHHCRHYHQQQQKQRPDEQQLLQRSNKIIEIPGTTVMTLLHEREVQRLYLSEMKRIASSDFGDLSLSEASWLKDLCLHHAEEERKAAVANGKRSMTMWKDDVVEPSMCTCEKAGTGGRTASL